MKPLQWPGMHECCVCVSLYSNSEHHSLDSTTMCLYIYLGAKNIENVQFLSYNYFRNLLREHLVYPDQIK